MATCVLAMGRAAAIMAAILACEGTSTAAEPGAATGEVALPVDVAPYWAWLPADTETAIVARDVACKSPLDLPPGGGEELTAEQRQQLQQQSLVAMSKSESLGPLPHLGGGNMLESGRYMKLLAGVTAPLVVYGGRVCEAVSAFGGTRYHGASILTFAEGDMAPVDGWVAALEKDASEVRTIGGREVLVFAYDKKLMEPAFEVLPWQGTYVVRVAPNVIVGATSDVYLKEMLARIDEAPGDRALPVELPQWKYVDTTASVWGLRRIPAVAGQKLAGVTWLAEPAGRSTFEVYYRWTGEADTDMLVKSWSRSATRDGAAIADRHRELIETHADGVTQVTLPLAEVGREPQLPLFTFSVLPCTPGTW